MKHVRQATRPSFRAYDLNRGAVDPTREMILSPADDLRACFVDVTVPPRAGPLRIVGFDFGEAVSSSTTADGDVAGDRPR